MDESPDQPRKTRRTDEPERRPKRRKISEAPESEDDMQYWPPENRTQVNSGGLLEALQSHDEARLTQTLSKLATDLSVLQDEELGRYPVPQLVPLLVKLLAHSASSEVLMHAVNSCVHLLDAMPSLSRLFVSAQLIPVLAQKLAAFEFIDVAEGAVKALEKLSRDHASIIVQEGLLTTLANLVGFFDIEIQKQVIEILNQCAKSVIASEQFLSIVESALPALTMLFHGELADKLLSFFCNLLESLAEGCGRDPVQLKSYAESLSASLLKNLWELLNAQPRLSPKIFEVLAQLAAASCEVSAAVHNLGVVLSLKASLSFEVASKAELDFLSAAFKLLGSLLPESPEISQTDSEKRKMYAEHPQLITSIAEAVVPRVLQQFDYLVSRNLKCLALQNFLRVLMLLEAETLLELVNPVHLAVLVQELLYGHDFDCVRYALKIVILAYEKAPTHFSPPFLREGVIARVADWTEPKAEQPRSMENLFDVFFSERFNQAAQDTDFRLQRRLLELRRSSSSSQRSRSRSSISNDLVALSKKILKLHQKYGTETTSKLCSELSRLSKALGHKFYSPEAVLKWVMSHFEGSEGVTSYELFTSGFAEALWIWLNQGLENLRLLQSVCCHTGNFEQLLQLLISSLRYSENFKANKASPTACKSQVNMLYLNNSSSDSAVEIKRKVFRGAETFQLALDLSSSLETLETELLRVNSSEDLEQLKYFSDGRLRRNPIESMIHNYIELDLRQQRDLGFRVHTKPPTLNLTVEFSVSGKALPKHVPLSQLLSEGSELAFKFVKKTAKVTEFLSQDEYFGHLLDTAKKVDVDASEQILNVLRLLKLVYFANHAYDLGLSAQAFHSAKLTSLVTQVLNDFSGLGSKMLPPWVNSLLNSCHFLFPFNLRNRLMKSASNPDMPQIVGNRARSRSGSFNKHRVTVRRGEILEAARAALSSSPILKHNIFEYEYIGEEGTGQGPTLEFYYLLSQEIRGLPVWRPGNTLFPMPSLQPDLDTFAFIGRVVGKALVDDRLLDLPLSPVFWKLVLNQSISAEDLRFIDQGLSKQLKALLTLEESKVEDLTLHFTLPGPDAIELKPGGHNIQVTSANVKEYCDLVSKASLMQTAQAAAFKSGLEELVDLEKYRQFDWYEIEDLVCGAGLEKWDFQTLLEAIVPAHGYNSQSATYINLLTILSQFTQEDRRLFLTFVTGSPRLPIGGFKGFVPPLTVVKKDAGDNCLPSVMTCYNYLKLPDYSDISLLTRALTYAIHEGRENFHFS
mmetsp:Transcript_8063/g.15862  ORF Transcript_8063/g.15862 Transcript_8063/m.15862 type:complete len:1257 (-) Transcript_8063:6073-9843(-)